MAARFPTSNTVDLWEIDRRRFDDVLVWLYLVGNGQKLRDDQVGPALRTDKLGFRTTNEKVRFIDQQFIS